MKIWMLIMITLIDILSGPLWKNLKMMNEASSSDHSVDLLYLLYPNFTFSKASWQIGLSREIGLHIGTNCRRFW